MYLREMSVGGRSSLDPETGRPETGSASRIKPPGRTGRREAETASRPKQPWSRANVARTEIEMMMVMMEMDEKGG